LQLRARNRATRGVRAMKLKEGDRLAAMDIVPASLLSKYALCWTFTP